jgi:hypothetical protein
MLAIYYRSKRLDADEKLQYFQLPYIPCRMVSGNEINLCLKYFCLSIYFVHFEISLTEKTSNETDKSLFYKTLF